MPRDHHRQGAVHARHGEHVRQERGAGLWGVASEHYEHNMTGFVAQCVLTYLLFNKAVWTITHNDITRLYCSPAVDTTWNLNSDLPYAQQQYAIVCCLIAFHDDVGTLPRQEGSALVRHHRCWLGTQHCIVSGSLPMLERFRQHRIEFFRHVHSTQHAQTQQHIEITGLHAKLQCVLDRQAALESILESLQEKCASLQTDHGSLCQELERASRQMHGRIHALHALVDNSASVQQTRLANNQQ
eukprot:751579-Hanusia_phi.AAC.2